MLWPAIILIIAAVVLAIIGLSITNGSGSGDERAGGAIFIIFAIMAGAGGVFWWLVAVTIKAFT